MSQQSACPLFCDKSSSFATAQLTPWRNNYFPILSIWNFWVFNLYFFLHFKQNERHCLIVSKFFIQWFRVLVDCRLYWLSLSTWENFVPHLISRTNYSKLTSESISALDFIWSILINSFLNNKAIFLYLFLSNFFSDKKH